MSRARDLAKLGNTNVIAVNGTDIGFGTLDPKEKVNVVGVVSATAFYGDGSELEGIASAGIGTALSDDKTKALNTIYYTNDEVLVTNNSTINPPASGHIAYTQAPTIVVDDTVEITVSDGDDLLVDVLGISTGTNVDYAARGNGVFGSIYVDNIYNQSGQSSVNFPKGIVSSGITTITDGTQSTSATTGALQVIGGVGIAKSVYIGGNLSVGGTITYEDVTNVDSVGLITARSGIRVTGGDVGIGIDNPDSLLHISKGTNTDDGAVTFTIGGTAVNTRQSTITKNNVGSNDRPLEIRAATGASHETIKFFSDATTERLRIGQSGQLGVAGANYGSSGQVLTSGGPSAAPQWADAGGGEWTLLASGTPTSGTHSVITESLITSTYWRYKVVFNMNCTAQGLFGFQIKNGSGWITSATYFHHQFYVDGNTETSDYYNNGEFMRPFWFPDGGRQWRGTLNLWNPSASDGEKYWHYENVQALNQSTYDGSSYFWSGGQSVSGSFRSNTSAITGLRMYMEEGITERCGGGTDTAGVSQWVLYGAKSS